MTTPKSTKAIEFEERFKSLVDELDVRAVFVLIDGFDPVKGARLLTGGDEPLCNLVDSAMRAYHEVTPS